MAQSMLQIFVKDSAIMNQAVGHWTVASSVKIITMKTFHSLDTANLLTFDLDTSCATVMIRVCKKNTVIHHPCSVFFAQHAFSSFECSDSF